jgi:L-alanine-DL-glutamate epimerase-like enolase superfamily enzyme
VSNLAAAHVAACCPNGVIVENTGRPDKRPAWMKDLFGGGDIVIANGYAALPDKPGLGCDLDERIAADHPYQEGDLPKLEFPDGAPADW